MENIASEADIRISAAAVARRPKQLLKTHLNLYPEAFTSHPSDLPVSASRCGSIDGRHGFHAESQLSPRSTKDVEVPFRSSTGLVGGETGVVSASPILDTSSPIADEAIAHFRTEIGIEPSESGTHDRFSGDVATRAQWADESTDNAAL